MSKSKKLQDHARRGGGCLLILFLLVGLYYGLYFLLRGDRTVRPEIIAHRGAHRGQSGSLPENTLVAFRNAVDLGADRLELDVQMTRDGELVVIHDETVDRTTNGTGRVAELTLTEIRALDAGQGQQVPTFKEVLQLAAETEMSILPEAKSPHLYPGLEEKMVEQVVAAGFIDRTVIQSFDGASLERIRMINPDISVCALYDLWDFQLGTPQPGGAKIVAPMGEMVLLFPWMIRSARLAGQQVFVWFGIIEHPLVMRLVVALGADGLIVDDTASLAAILGTSF
jgi:glycerophosphoryl diester phosphodiesterase